MKRETKRKKKNREIFAWEVEQGERQVLSRLCTNQGEFVTLVLMQRNITDIFGVSSREFVEC